MLLRKVHSGSDKSLRGCDKKNNEKSNSRTIGNIFIVSQVIQKSFQCIYWKSSFFGSSLLSPHIIIVIVILNNQEIFFSQLLSFSLFLSF